MTVQYSPSKEKLHQKNNILVVWHLFAKFQALFSNYFFASKPEIKLRIIKMRANFQRHFMGNSQGENRKIRDALSR